MTTEPDFHSTGSEDGEELVYHNQIECALGGELKKKGTAALGQGYYRTLCPQCRSVREGWSRSDPL